MKTLFLTSLLAGTSLFISTTVYAANDQITLHNGDVISGEITAQGDTGVTINTAYGALTIPSNQVNTMTMAETQAETTKTVEALETIEPAAGDADASGLWGAVWNGNVNAGAELETGNSDSSNYAIDGKIEANWADKHRAKIAVDYEFEEEEDATVTDERELDLTYDYFFNDKWFWNNTASFEQDKVENLDLRTELITGLGYRFYNRDDLNLEVTFGPGFEREEYEDLDTEDNMTANWSLGYKQSFYEDVMRLYHNHSIHTPTDDLSSYLFESDSGIEVPISFGIVAKGEIEFDWNNDPALGETEDDTTYRLLLGYEW